MTDDHARKAFQPQADDHHGVRFSLLMPPALDELLTARARQLQCSRGAVVRMILCGNLTPLADGQVSWVQR